MREGGRAKGWGVGGGSAHPLRPAAAPGPVPSAPTRGQREGGAGSLRSLRRTFRKPGPGQNPRPWHAIPLLLLLLLSLALSLSLSLSHTHIHTPHTRTNRSRAVAGGRGTGAEEGTGRNRPRGGGGGGKRLDLVAVRAGAKEQADGIDVALGGGEVQRAQALADGRPVGSRLSGRRERGAAP